jgi:hypothetical protein
MFLKFRKTRVAKVSEFQKRTTSDDPPDCGSVLADNMGMRPFDCTVARRCGEGGFAAPRS